MRNAETRELAAKPGNGAPATLTFSCVILTLGDRPDELKRAVHSIQAQHGDPVEIVVVANGGDVPEPAAGVKVVRLTENTGVPGGRNIGADASAGDVVLFLDDDGWLPDRGTVQRLRDAFTSRPSLGVISFRIVDPDTGVTQRRHVPRLRVGDPEESSDVTSFLGGASAIRRSVFDECGGQPAAFFYSHEEIDLAWRALDAGYDIQYDAGAIMYHPQGDPSVRHPTFYFNNARNRVWLARRRLPVALIPPYLATWTGITVMRHRHAAMLRVWFRGFAEGWRSDPGERRPIRWRTVWRMTRLGRPPVI